MDAVRSELIQAAIEGNEVDVSRLIVHEWPNAYRIAYAILGDRGLAEDSAQESCVIVAQKMRQLRSVTGFAPWFYRIVYRESQRIRKRSKSIVAAGDLPETAADDVDPMLRLDVCAALGRLSIPQRTAIILQVYAGMTTLEISSVLSLPHSTVRSHIARGRRTLETLLSDHHPAHRPFREVLAGAI